MIHAASRRLMLAQPLKFARSSATDLQFIVTSLALGVRPSLTVFLLTGDRVVQFLAPPPPPTTTTDLGPCIYSWRDGSISIPHRPPTSNTTTTGKNGLQATPLHVEFWRVSVCRWDMQTLIEAAVLGIGIVLLLRAFVHQVWRSSGSRSPPKLVICLIRT